MGDQELLATAATLLDDETKFREFTVVGLRSQFGRAYMGAIDWQRAVREVFERMDYPFTPEGWLRSVGEVAWAINEWSIVDDEDYSWFTAEEQERRRRLTVGECEDA